MYIVCMRLWITHVSNTEILSDYLEQYLYNYTLSDAVEY